MGAPRLARRRRPHGILDAGQLRDSQVEGSVICTYDLTRFGESVVMDALRTHPLVIIGGLLQENAFYVSPDQLLLEIRARRWTRKSRARGAGMSIDAAETRTANRAQGSRGACRHRRRWPAGNRAVAAGLADTLLELFQLDFVFVRLRLPGVAAQSMLREGTHGRRFQNCWQGIMPRAVGSPASRPFPTSTVMLDHAMVLPFQPVNAEGGIVAAACGRAVSPETDRLMLGLPRIKLRQHSRAHAYPRARQG